MITPFATPSTAITLEQMRAQLERERACLEAIDAARERARKRWLRLSHKRAVQFQRMRVWEEVVDIVGDM